MRIRHFWPGILIMGLLMVVLMASISAAAAANTVPSSRIENNSRSITADDLKPSQCTMQIDYIYTGNGTINGSNQNDLILAGAGNNTIRGRNGDDCILGGNGNDNINGGNGTDVCIGGGGTDTFSNCETVIQ